MELFSYVVARDFGFAPNPFYGVCTLATCKPGIRKGADIGDWVIGTGSASKGKAQDRRDFLVYAMRVTEVMTFNEYWNDSRFRRKRPNLRGSLKQGYGDNIYFKDESGEWHQQDSHHSYKDGEQNCHNIWHDTKIDRILISTDYIYWGGKGPKIPEKFRNYKGEDIRKKRSGYKRNFPPDLIEEFVKWLRSLDASGYIGEPLDWPRTHHDRKVPIART